MTKLLMVGGVFVIGVAILVGMAVREGGIPTVLVSDVTSPAYEGEPVFLIVQVSRIEQMANPARFAVLDKKGGITPLNVETREVLSDTFAVQSDLRIKGTYDPDRETFTATYIDTKCPSKYDGEEYVESADSRIPDPPSGSYDGHDGPE